MEQQFHAYGPSHWVILAVFVLGAVLLVSCGRSLTEVRARRLGRALGAVTAIIYAVITSARRVGGDLSHLGSGHASHVA